MQIIDLRSDTVTKPDHKMREAMSLAEIGDDVFGDDPTVIKLESLAAELFGKESALFLPSGTQSNLAALLTHCQRGEEYIVGQEAHTYLYEGGGGAWWVGREFSATGCRWLPRFRHQRRARTGCQ